MVLKGEGFHQGDGSCTGLSIYWCSLSFGRSPIGIIFHQDDRPISQGSLIRLVSHQGSLSSLSFILGGLIRVVFCHSGLSSGGLSVGWSHQDSLIRVVFDRGFNYHQECALISFLWVCHQLDLRILTLHPPEKRRSQ